MISNERLAPDYDMLGKDALMEIFRNADSSMVQELTLRLIKAENELLAYRKAFSGEPDAYVVTGGKFFKDTVCSMKGEALEAVSTRKDSSYILELYRKPPNRRSVTPFCDNR